MLGLVLRLEGLGLEGLGLEGLGLKGLGLGLKVFRVRLVISVMVMVMVW